MLTARRPEGLGSRLWRWVKRGLALVAVFAVLGAATAVGTYLYFDRGLPSVDELRNYRPPLVTKVVCADGSVCAEFYRERRTWVEVDTLPAHVRNAFLAAEDSDFYKHEGIDFIGVLRAGVKSLLPGRRASGASTISQQACRNLLLTQERTLSRKIKEWILTPRMEKALTKDQILTLYLNAINFGHGRYGVEEAALYYFGKHARDLNVGEAAVLGGIPQLPHRINPVTNIVKAKKRQRYVLSQMWQHGFLARAQAEAEMERPIVLGPRPAPRVGLYYAEEVRKTLVARYGEEAVHAGGLRVEIAMDPKLQAMADDAVRAGLESLDRRQGYRGPLGNVAAERFDALRPLLVQRIAEAGKRQADEELVADLAALSAAPAPSEDSEGTEEVASDNEASGAEPEPTADELLARKVPIRPLREGLRLVGRVTQVEDARKRAVVDFVGRSATLGFESVQWARPRKNGRVGIAPTKMSDVVAVGDLVRVKVTQLDAKAVEVTLDQLPEAQGALAVIEPQSRRLVAMVGGYDFTRSAFNRAVQAKRQPGSAFKPFLYAAALASERYTPLSVVNDAPEAVRDPWTGKTWKPQNYERGGFEGPMTLRQALTKSKNTVSVRLIEALTPQVAIDFARRAGIQSPLPDNLTLALGTGEVSLVELVNAYATLHSLGQYAEPQTLMRVTRADGTVLEEHQAAFEEVLPPAVAYLATSLMRSVVEEGTATAVQELNRPAAGKTGTAQEFRDAWFAGYTRQYVAAAWVGFDNHDPLGAGETGGRAALPIWLQFMKAAHENEPSLDFEVPTGVVLARVDPQTGLLAGASVPGRDEPFLEGTEPTQEAPPPGQVTPDDYLLHEQGQGGL